jgi:hypothetical protein
MSEDQASSLRKAIENLISAKLYDMMARPGGLDRLVANRMTGVASHDVRNAEQQLDRTLSELLADAPQGEAQAETQIDEHRPSRAVESAGESAVGSGRRPGRRHAQVAAGV